MKQHLLAGLLTLAILITGCAPKDKGPKQADIKPVPLNSFHKAWYTDLGLGKAKATDIYFFDQFIIVYSSANNAHVVDRATGALKFIHPLPRDAGDQHAPSVLGDRIIYPATSAFKVYSAKGAGSLLKEISNSKYAIRNGGAGSGQFYYLIADYENGGRLVAIDLENTTLPRWEIMTNASMRSQPVHLNSITYFADEKGVVRAVNEQRASIWALGGPDGGFQADRAVFADLTIDTNTLYVASMDTKLYALQQASGQIKWTYFAGVPLNHKPEATADTVYIPIDRRGLVAINKNEGKDFREPKWTNAEAAQFLADDAQHTYVRLKNGAIAALDKATGKQKWASSRKDFTTYGVNPKDGQIYVTTPRGELLCVKAVTKVGVVGEVVLDDSRPDEFAAR